MPAPKRVIRRAPAKKAAPKRIIRRANPGASVQRAMLRDLGPRRRAAAPKRSSGGSSLGTAIGSAIGLALGGPGGAAAGGMIGSAGGNFLSKIFGHGDYQVSNSNMIKSNNLISNSANIPQFGTGKVATNFRHREFLGDVISSSTANTFKIDSFSINPGVDATFPWLAGVVGAKYQQYRINGMTFEFRSMSADALNSTNTALGSVIMSTDYDSADTAFTSKQQMENTEYGVSCKPSVNMMHGIECERSQTPVSELYIRAFDVPSGKDVRFYDIGRFSIASTGCQGTNVNLGELWVSYDIDCFKAIEQVPGFLIPFSQYALVGTLPASAPLGTSQSQLLTQAGNEVAMTFTANKMSWPLSIDVGSIWHVQINWLRTSSALTAPVITSGNGMFFNTNTVWKTITGTTCTDIRVDVDVQYQGGANAANLPYLNIANFTHAGANQQSDLYITQMSGLWPGTYTSQTQSLPPEDEEETSPEYIEEMEQKKPQQTISKGMSKMRIGFL